MGKIAFVFSGQGAQAPGMGLDLYENSPAARAAFDALEAIRPGTLDQCFRGSEAELQETANTQPCMVAMELAALAAMREAGITPDMAAGFSLGELSALCCGGAMDAQTAFRLTCRRGELMQRAAEANDFFGVAYQGDQFRMEERSAKLFVSDEKILRIVIIEFGGDLI